MRLSFVGLFLFATCSFGEMYRCERIFTASVNGDSDVKKDTSRIMNSAQLSVVRTTDNSMLIQLIQADAEVHSGNNMLKLDEPLSSLAAKMKERQSEIKQISVLLSSQGIKVLSGKEPVADGENWGRIENVLFDAVATEKITFAAIVPVLNLIAKIPLLLSMPDDVQPGDVIDIPFVPPAPLGRTLSSEERPSQLICTNRNGNLLEFVSNVNKSDEDYLQVKWDVRLTYDISRQVPVNVEIDRITKMKDLGFKQFHIVQETLSFGPSGADK